MNENQQHLLRKLEHSQTNITKGFMDYWFKYSSFDNWHFWVNVLLLVIPLIILYFKIDREKALLLGFFGFNVHIWFTYIDTFGGKLGYWSYPYQLMPLVSVNFGLDVSFVPVSFMFLYQWVLNNNKNYYIYSIALSLVFSFVLKPILVGLNFFELTKGTTYFHLFICYVVIALVSKWITNLFLNFVKKTTQ